MQSRSSSKDALLPLLGELYDRIYTAEIEIGLWAGQNDHRPRIERFHDAVRAYTSGVSPYDPASRLAIEQLAWDISMLKSIQSSPLMPIPNSQKQSANTGLAVRTPNALGETGNPRMAARALKGQLADDYKNYGVMFSALLAETADMNHNSRMEEKDAMVEELANLRSNISGKITDLHNLAGSNIYDPQILSEVQSMLPKDSIASEQARAALNNAMSQIDTEQQKLEKSHITWLSNQNAMYQQGKEVVQQLMRNGLNLAGRFLEESMARGGGQTHGRGY